MSDIHTTKLNRTIGEITKFTISMGYFNIPFGQISQRKNIIETIIFNYNSIKL
jgi:hypothetical protein